MLLEHSMKEFLDKKRYHYNPGFIIYCLKFPEYNSDLHQSLGGAQASPLYRSWVEHLEVQGELQQASAVFLERNSRPG